MTEIKRYKSPIRIRIITAKYGLKPSNNKGDIQGRP